MPSEVIVGCLSLAGTLIDSIAGILTANIVLNDTPKSVATIPSGYRPSIPIVLLVQASGMNIALCRINTEGVISLERLRTMNSTAYQTATAGYWFPISTSWVIS